MTSISDLKCYMRILPFFCKLCPWTLFRLRGVLFYSILVVTCLIFGYFYWDLNRFLDENKLQSEKDLNVNRSTTSRISFSVNTSTCKIPDFEPWDTSTYLQTKRCQLSDLRNPNCAKRAGRKWMYVDGQHLVVNLTALQNSGYNWDTNQMYCCYRVLQRAHNLGKYNDETVTLSKECTHITQVRTEMKQEFIRIFCYSISSPFQFLDVLYREYFAFALVSSHAKEKIMKWKNIADDMIPPNVIILGIDSNSRLNSWRWMPKTVDLLRKLEAVELFGYTKVGENTYPNTVPFLTGMHTWEMDPQYCSPRDATHDKCPYIWKTFDQVGYLTAMAEDVPYSTCFNLNAYGFEKIPTDFYYRPLPFFISRRGPRERGGIIKCIGGYQSEEILLNYITDVLLKSSNTTPTFVFTWLQAFSHECSQSVRISDTSISNFIQTTINTTNSIIFFLSDHGERYGPFRETALGWYEDKLPTMWVYLPPKVRKKFPNWIDNLRINSRRLTSPFDIYYTFTHILDSFDVNKTLNVYQTIPNHFKKKGYSLFSEMPENRTCDDAGIPSAFCACAQPQTLDLSIESIKNSTLNAGNAALLYLRNNLPSQCATLVLKKILQANSVKTPKGPVMFVISVLTEPGDFQFEISVRTASSSSLNTFVINDFGDILRLDKMRRDASCVSNTVLQRYCYCK